MENINCNYCKGKMEVQEIPKYNKLITIITIILGILFSITLTGIVIGLLFLIVGLYMVYSKKEVWYCTSCKSIIERMAEKKP